MGDDVVSLTDQVNIEAQAVLIKSALQCTASSEHIVWRRSYPIKSVLCLAMGEQAKTR